MAATQIAGRQIKDGAIADQQVAAGAAIASSKLADGANFTKKDGSVAFTGNQSMGNNKITSLATPSTSTDAATMGYVDTQIASLNSIFKYKTPVIAKSTGNVTVSSPGTAVFDTITLTSGDRILLASQTTGSENGIYIFNGSGSAMTRATDMDAWGEVAGALVVVEKGSVGADTLWLCTSDEGGTLGSTSIAFTQVNSSGLTSSNFVDEETPSGSINGSNTSFSLANTPISGSVHLYLNGQRQKSGAGNDYTISSATITMLTAPVSGDVLIADYRK